MHALEYGDYFFRPIYDYPFLEAEFVNPVTQQTEWISQFITSESNGRKWGIRNHVKNDFYFIDTPGILKLIKGNSPLGQDYVKTRYANGYTMSMYIPLLTKLIEIKFLAKLLPHEESGLEFDLI